MKSVTFNHFPFLPFLFSFFNLSPFLPAEVKEKLCKKLLQNKTLPLTLSFQLSLTDRFHKWIQDKTRHIAFIYFHICPQDTYASFGLLFLLIFDKSHDFSCHKVLWIGCCKSKSCEAVVLFIPCSVQGQQQMWPEVLLLESWPSLSDSLTTWEGHHN